MIKYKDYEIDETKDIFNLTPEEVFRYADSLPISKKRKLKFIDLYNTFKLNGVNNIDTSDDIPKFTFNGEIDLSNRKDSEVAGYVVDYLNRGLRKKYTSLTKEKEEKEKNIPLYTNESFQNDIQEQIIRDYFKGRKDVNLNKEWDDVLDKRNEETGLYSTEGRAKVFSDQLRNYANSLKEDSYKFDETTPFKSLDEFKTALNSAADKLANNDLSGLNDIGFPQSKWFSDRGEDPFTDSEGNTYTAKDYYSAKYLQELKKLEEEALALQLKQAKIDLGNKGIISKIGGIHAVEARNKAQDYQLWLATSKYGTGLLGFNKMNARILKLIDQATTSGLTGADKKELGNLLYYVRDKNPHYQGLGNGKQTNISDAEWNELRLHTDQLSSVTRENFIRLPWQVLSGNSKGRYVYADNQGNLYFLKPQNHQQFALNFNKSSKYNDYKNNFLSNTNPQLLRSMNTPIAQLDGLTPELSRELGAIALDFGAMINPEAVTGTAMALTAAGLREKNRLPGFSWEKVLDWGTAGLGGLPVIGDLLSGSKTLYKLGKLINTSAQAAGYVTTALGTVVGGVLAKNIVTKLANDPTSLSTLDLLNLAYGLMGIVGGAKTVRAVKSGKAYNNANSTVENTVSVKTASGKTVKVKVNDAEAQQITNAYKSAKNNQEADLAVIKLLKNKTSENLEGAKIQNGAGWARGSELGRKFTSTPDPVLRRYIPNTENNYPVSWKSMINPLRAKVLNRRVVPQENEKGFFRRANDFIFGNYESKPILLSTDASLLSISSTPTTTEQSSVKQLPFHSNSKVDKQKVSKYLDNFKLGKSTNSSEELIFNIDDNTGGFKLGDNKSLTYFKLADGKYRAVWTIGEKLYTKNFNSIKLLKERMSKLANDLILEHKGKINYKETAEMLRSMEAFRLIKANKLGGIIDKQRILKYKEYIRK